MVSLLHRKTVIVQKYFLRHFVIYSIGEKIKVQRAFSQKQLNTYFFRNKSKFTIAVLPKKGFFIIFLLLSLKNLET